MTLVIEKTPPGALRIRNPSGQTRKGEEVMCLSPRAEDGIKVPCIESNLHIHYVHYKRFLQHNISQMYLGQSVKACPMSDLKSLKAVRIFASREDVKARLRRGRHWQHINTMSPLEISSRGHWHLFRIHWAPQLNDCRAPLSEPTILSLQEQDIQSAFAFHNAWIQRGYTHLKKTCEGRLY